MESLFPAVVLRKAVSCTTLVVALTVLAVGCTSGDDDQATPDQQVPPASPRAAAEQLIAGPMAEVIGLGPLAATCPEMTEAAVGDVFQCSALTEAQSTINVAAEIMPTGQVDLSTTNVITAEAVASFEQAAVDALNTTLADPLSYEAMDCGTTSLVLPAEQTVVCGLLDPATEAVFDVTLSITDLESRQFSLAVADLPRR